MPKPPTDTEPASWHRHFAMVANNRAWQLAEERDGPANDAEMIAAAHTAAWHWAKVGTEQHRMRAAMLLANVHALAGDGTGAMRHAVPMHAWFTREGNDTPDWELAFAHAIRAHAAHAAGDAALHASAHAEAKQALEAIADAEDRGIVEKTFRQVPVPR